MATGPLRGIACVLAFCACCAHAQDAERRWRPALATDLPAPRDPPPARPAVAADARPVAQRAYIDPLTDTLVSAPVVAAEPLEADTLQAAMPTDEFALRTTPEGWIYIRTESLQHYATAHLHADGSLVFACTDHPPQAAATGPQP